MSGRAPKSFKSTTIQYPSENTQSSGQYELMTSARRPPRGNRNQDNAKKALNNTNNLNVQGEATSSLEKIMEDLNSDTSKIILLGKKRVSRRNLNKVSNKTSEASSDEAENPTSSIDEKTDFSILSDDAENPRSSDEMWGSQRKKKLSKKLLELPTDYSSTFSQTSNSGNKNLIQSEKIPPALMPRYDSGSERSQNNNAYSNAKNNANSNYSGRYSGYSSNNSGRYSANNNASNYANHSGRKNANNGYINNARNNAKYNAKNDGMDDANKTFIQSEKVPPALAARNYNSSNDNGFANDANFNAKYKATYNAYNKTKGSNLLCTDNEIWKKANCMLGTSSEDRCQGEMKSEKVPPASLQSQCSDDMKKHKMAATMAFCTPRQNEPEEKSNICECSENIILKCTMSTTPEQMAETKDKMAVECNPIKCQNICCEEKCDFTAAIESKKVTSASASASTSPLVLYYDIMSPQSRSCLMLICLLKLDVDLRYTDLLKGDQLTKEYLEINPVHTVPTLLHDNLVFTDSHTILMYLCDTFPSAQAAELFPTCYLERMKIMNMLFFEAQVLYRRHSNFMTDIVRKDFANVDYYFHEKKITEAYEALDKFLKESSFLVGDKLTIADISMVATISALDLMFPIDLYTHTLPRLADWFRCMRAIPMYRLNFAGVQKQSEIVEQVGKFHIPSVTSR